MKSRGVILAMILGTTLMGGVGCRKTPPRIQIGDVERCEAGIERALKQTTAEEGLRIYYVECSGVYAEPACKAAFVKAANLPPEQRTQAVADPCRAAYCPDLEERDELEACGSDFQPSKDSLERSWPGLHNAILKHDARGLAPRLTRMMLGFYTRSKTWPSPSAATSAAEEGSAAASAAKAGSAAEAPPAAPSAAPQGSAAPVASAGAAGPNRKSP